MVKQIKKQDKEDLNIYPLKIDESKLGRISKNILPDIPFLLCIIGRVKAGKGVIVNNLALSPRFYGEDFDNIIFISPTAYSDPINKYLVEEATFTFEQYSDELMDQILEIIEEDDSNNKFLIILDDIVGNVKFKRNTSKIDKMTELATKYRHIGNGEIEGKVSIIITTQYLKYLSPILRLSASAYIITGNQSPAELKAMSEEMSIFTKGDPKKFYEVYNKSKKENYDFLFLSMKDMKARRNFAEILNTDTEDEDDEKEEKNAEEIDAEKTMKK